MGRMGSVERQIKLQELLTGVDEFVNLSDLCRRLNASRSSLRRDLIELEQRGILRRVHGGAISISQRDESMDYRKLASSRHEEKARIGKATAALIENGQTVIMGGGSTTVEVARHLLDRPLRIQCHLRRCFGNPGKWKLL